MNTSTIADLKAAIEAAGGALEQDAPNVYQACAPDGRVWCASDGPHLCITWWPGDSAARRYEIKSGIERAKAGLRDATADELYLMGQDAA